MIPTPLSIEAPARQRSRPIHVCYIIDRLNRAGTETQLLALIRGLNRQRVRPFLCLLDGEDALSQQLLPDDCPSICLGVKSLLSPRAIAAGRSLTRFWRKNRIDVVQSYFLDSTYFSTLLGRLAGVRPLIRVRNNLGYWITGKHRWLNRVMGRVSDWTLTNSDSGKQAIVEMDRIAAGRVEVLENGVDLDRFMDHAPPDTKRPIVRIGAVANLRPVKNIDGLIDACATVARSFPGIQLEIAGEGDQRPLLEEQIRRYGCEQNFCLRGSLPDIPAFLGSLDIAVLPSHSEGMSNALLEYMASGRAIIATDVGANARLVRHGIDGLIVPPRNPTALCEALQALLRDPHLAKQLAASARERVNMEYSRPAMIRRFEAFYQRITAA